MPATAPARPIALAIFALSVALRTSGAQLANPPKPEPVVTAGDVAWLSIATAASIGIMQLDARIARGSQDSSLQRNAALQDGAVVVTEMHERGARHQAVVAPPLYALAAGPGLSRIYGDKHWTSDVVMGAALGVVTGVRTVKYAHGHKQSRFDRWSLGHASASTGATGPVVAVGWTF